MVIHCTKCGRPLCTIDVPDVSEADLGRPMRAMGRLGVDLSDLLPDISKLLKPTPETIAEHFKPRCVDAC